MKKHPTHNKKLINWVNKVARLCQPEDIIWIDGSGEQKQRLEQEAMYTEEMIQLNQEKLPGCFLHRTALDDVARTEHLTYICTKRKRDAGPNNNWMSPRSAYAKAKADRIYLEEFRKSKKALLMKDALGKGIEAANAQEREAYADPEYQILLRGLQEAIEAEETLKWMLEAARMKTDIWRTEQANIRLEVKSTV